MVTLTALVLTITMVVVQLAMGQFSPRIVQTLPARQAEPDRDRALRRHLRPRDAGHARGALRTTDGTVPGLAIVVAYVLVVDQHRRARALRAPHRPSLRVSTLIELVGKRHARSCSTAPYPDHGADRSPAGTAAAVCADHSGVSCTSTHERLVERRARGRLRARAARRRSATSCPPARRCSVVDGDGAPLDDDDVRRAASSSASSARSTRTSPTASACSSTSPSARSPSRRSSTRRPPCRRSTACTTACASSRRRPFPSGAPRRRTGTSAWSSRRWTGTPTSAWPSTRSAAPAPARRRSRAGSSPPSTTCARSPCRSAWHASTGSSSCSPKLCRPPQRTARTATRASCWKPDRQGLGPAAGAGRGP